MSNERKIVAFHIGRGGRFNNPGYLRFVGEKTIRDFTDYLYTRYENEKKVRDELKEKFGSYLWQEAKLDGKSLEDTFLDLCSDENKASIVEIFEIEEDALGEIEYYGGNGEAVGLTQTEFNMGIGRINIDHSYDTTYTVYLDECDEEELLTIAQEQEWGLLREFGFEFAWEAYTHDKLVNMVRYNWQTLEDLGIEKEEV